MENHFRRQWTENDDEMLLELISEDLPFRVIADRLGRTRNSCIGRMHRLSKKIEAMAAE